MLATINRWLATALFVLGGCLGAVGVYLGGFAWLNDGFKAGVRLFATTAAFGLALAGAGFALRFAASAHARGDTYRWWIQFGALLAAYVAFGLAAWTTSLVDRIWKP